MRAILTLAFVIGLTISSLATAATTAPAPASVGDGNPDWCLPSMAVSFDGTFLGDNFLLGLYNGTGGARGIAYFETNGTDTNFRVSFSGPLSIFYDVYAFWSASSQQIIAAAYTVNQEDTPPSYSCTVVAFEDVAQFNFCANATGLAFQDNVRYGQSISAERYFGYFGDTSIFMDIVRDANNPGLAYPLHHYMYDTNLITIAEMGFYNSRSYVDPDVFDVPTLCELEIQKALKAPKKKLPTVGFPFKL